MAARAEITLPRHLGLVRRRVFCVFFRGAVTRLTGDTFMIPLSLLGDLFFMAFEACFGSRVLDFFGQLSLDGRCPVEPLLFQRRWNRKSPDEQDARNQNHENDGKPNDLLGDSSRFFIHSKLPKS